MIDGLFEQIRQQKDVRAALSGLRAAIKEDENYSRAADLIGDGEVLRPLLMSEDAKVRKNTAALIGDLELTELSDALFLAYQKEQTLFVRGTLLKALEDTNAYPYLEKLRERYEALCEKEAEEQDKKHIREELHVLERILRKEGKEVIHTFTGWDQKYTILLTANQAYADLTAEKVHADKKAVTSLGVKAVVDNLREICKIRTFRELLFPIALKKEIHYEDGPEAFAKAVTESKLYQILQVSHKEPAPYYFRIDIKGGLSLEERSRYIKRAAAIIEEESGRKLLNAKDEYEFEIRLFFNKDRKIFVFLKMYTIPMERFAYRKESISASIRPSAAALLVELAKPYLKNNAQILDPCCGVGTMLIERNELVKAREIYGIDIFGEAIEKARINADAAGLLVNFIHRDYMDFKHKYLFDEIITNLPVRGKKTKEEQDLFYKRFFDKSKEILAPGGVMVLYSNENGFIKKQLRLHPEYKLYQEYLIIEKEQFYLYIIGLRNR